MKSIPFVAALSILIAPALASEYVTLDCDIIPAAKYSGSNNVIKRQIKLDESSSKVVDTETRINGRQNTREYAAIFSAGTIDWAWHIGDCCGIRYQIDRSTGDIKSFSKSDPTDVGSTGTCKVRKSTNMF